MKIHALLAVATLVALAGVRPVFAQWEVLGEYKTGTDRLKEAAKAARPKIAAMSVESLQAELAGFFSKGSVGLELVADGERDADSWETEHRITGATAEGRCVTWLEIPELVASENNKNPPRRHRIDWQRVTNVYWDSSSLNWVYLFGPHVPPGGVTRLKPASRQDSVALELIFDVLAEKCVSG